MSHIHLPDGVIPVFWWVLGYIITAIVLAVAFSRSKLPEARRKIPLLGIMAALMLVGQSVPLGFIPFHLSLAVIAGIALGPWLGFIAAFISNVFLALIGHGGITVVGLNTLVVGSEAVLGYLLFSFLRGYISSIARAAIAATAVTLIISVSLMIGVVALSQISPAIVLEDDHAQEEADHRENGIGEISISRFISIIVPVALIGIIIESLATGLIIRFILGVRPGLLGIWTL